MSTLRALKRFELRPLDDPNRMLADIELAAIAPPPSLGEVNVSATLCLWTGDDPTFRQLQLRALDTLSRVFAIPDELRTQLGAVYGSRQTPAAVNQ